VNDKNSEMVYNAPKNKENDLLQTEKLELDTFSYHLTTQYTATFGVMIFVMLIEIFPFHLLFSRWSDVIAWGVTLLSILFNTGHVVMYENPEVVSGAIMQICKMI